MQTLHGQERKRRYMIHQTNFRDSSGIPLDAKVKEVIFEEDQNMSFKGREWWHENLHRFNDPTRQESHLNVEASEVELADGTFVEDCLMDVFYTSYVVDLPFKKIRMRVTVTEEFDYEMPYDEWLQVQDPNSNKTFESFVQADVYVKTEWDSMNAIDLGGDFKIEKIGEAE